MHIRSAFSIIFQYFGWKDSIIEVSYAIELMKYHRKYKPKIIVLDCNFLYSNTILFASIIKEIDQKVYLAMIVDSEVYGNKDYKNIADYLIIKEQGTKKTVSSIFEIINNCNKHKKPLK